MDKKHPVDIIVIAGLMIIFGFAEIATGFTHNFLGLLSTASAVASTFGGVGIGAFYAIGGFFLLTTKKWAAIVAEICLILVMTPAVQRGTVAQGDVMGHPSAVPLPAGHLRFSARARILPYLPVSHSDPG